MKTSAIILSLIALSVPAHPMANEAESESSLFGPSPDFATNSYDPAADYGFGPASQDYAPVVPDYGPAPVGPDYEEDTPADKGCFSGLGSGGGGGRLGISIRRGNCKSKVNARQGLLGSRFKSKDKASFTEINL